MAASPIPRQPDPPPPAVPHFPTTVHPSSTTSDPPPLSPKPPPNPPVSTPSGQAITSISAPAPRPCSAGLPLPRDPFPPLPTARPSPAATSAIPSSNPLLPQPSPAPNASAHPLPNPLLPTPSPAAAIPGHGPVHSKSYAQATRSSRGTGFVRSHASDVASFARLPRTGVSIVCGSTEGMPSFSFVSTDLPAVENLFSNALIMKFHGGRPSLEASHREIRTWGIEYPFSIGPLSSRAFLLRFQDEKDLITVLSRPSSIINSFPYKIFRWHNLCHQLEDSCFAPVWISLPRLPLQCFVPEFLESVANKIGRFLCCDIATSTLARPSTARLCVELDLRQPPPPFIWVGLFEGYKQPVIYERMPKFCNRCQAQGHLAPVCPKGHRETRPIQAEPRFEPNRERTQPVRQNATGQSSPITDHQHAATASVHNSTTPPPSCSLCFAQGHAAVECPSGLREATTEQTDPPQSSFKDCTPSVRQNASQKLQSASDFQQASLPTNHSSPTPSSSPPSPLPAIHVPPLTTTIIPAILHNTTPSTSSLQQTDKQHNPAVCLPLQSNLDANQQALSAGTAPPHASSWAIPPLLSQQYNLKANQMFWNAVNQHLALASQQTSSPGAAIPPPPGSSSSRPLAADPHPLSAVSIAEGTPSVCHNADLPNSANNETLGEDQQIESIIEHPNSAAKPINLKQLEVDRSPLLNQQQQDALERFKKKVRAQTQSQGQQLIGSTSANPFEALIEDQSDEEDDDYIAASFNSDTDDGPVEPIDMGYQSADGRSSHNHTKSSSSVMKINKRHPNIPLNVRLRTRKNSYSSSHKYLCM